jgi:hypothetical protein
MRQLSLARQAADFEAVHANTYTKSKKRASPEYRREVQMQQNAQIRHKALFKCGVSY